MIIKEINSFKKQLLETSESGSSVVQTSSVIQATSVKTQHYNINMNQDSSVNNITIAITQAITNTDVPLTSKENTKNESNIENESNTICRESTKQDQLNENSKFKSKSVIILGDSMIKHKHMWNSKKAKTKMQSFCENLPRSNYPMCGC